MLGRIRGLDGTIQISIKQGMKSDYWASWIIISEAFSPIMIVGAFVFPDTNVGIIDASATRRPVTPLTLKRSSTTASSSLPIRQVPTGW